MFDKTGPFAIIDCSKKKNKRVVIEKLFTSLVKKGIVFIIVKTSPSIWERFRYKKIRLFSSISYILYKIDNLENCKDGIDYLLNISLWHYPIFHIIFTKKDFPKKLKAYLCQNKVRVNKFEEKFNEDIVGYIDFLDNILEFYGDQEIKQLIKEEFPDAENN